MGEYGPLCTLCAAGLRVEGCQVRMNQDRLGTVFVSGQRQGLRERRKVAGTGTRVAKTAKEGIRTASNLTGIN